MHKQPAPCGEDSLIAAQIDGLLQGDGAGEDHINVRNFFEDVGFTLPMANRIHRAIVHGERKPMTKDEVRDQMEAFALSAHAEAMSFGLSVDSFTRYQHAIVAAAEAHHNIKAA